MNQSITTPVHDAGVAIMNVNQLDTIEQLVKFLEGTQPVVFSIAKTIEDRHNWVQKTFVKFEYITLRKYAKGIVKQYIIKVTGYSCPQFARLARQYLKTGQLHKKTKITRTSFKKTYTSMDICLLAKTDELHGTLNGHTTKKICERAYNQFGQQEYERLATISASHIYNLRKSKGYKRQRWVYEETKPKVSKIGERRKPRPNGKPGYIRIDTVHQGDLDGEKGVYHINAVDEVTQFEVVCTVEKISEQYLIPVLESLLDTFPFVIVEFHSDNGSEYINQNVLKLLTKLHIELTKSRPRHTNDNALAESKNGSIVRKTLGHMHIPQRFAEPVNEFNKKYLNPYINFHRPCFFSEIKIDKKGKERKVYEYETMMTPYEKLKSILNAAVYLKPGVTFEDLDKIANELSDNESARQLQQARTKLFSLVLAEKEVV